jgi:hypothetical protein
MTILKNHSAFIFRVKQSSDTEVKAVQFSEMPVSVYHSTWPTIKTWICTNAVVRASNLKWVVTFTPGSFTLWERALIIHWAESYVDIKAKLDIIIKTVILNTVFLPLSYPSSKGSVQTSEMETQCLCQTHQVLLVTVSIGVTLTLLWHRTECLSSNSLIVTAWSIHFNGGRLTTALLTDCCKCKSTVMLSVHQSWAIYKNNVKRTEITRLIVPPSSVLILELITWFMAWFTVLF